MMMTNSSYFSLVILLIFLISYASTIEVNSLSSTEILTISGNRSILSSPGNTFALGFFKIPAAESGNEDRWYLGMWYKAIVRPRRVYVWVANRNRPLLNSHGVLKIYKSNLVILDQPSGNIVWSSDVVASSPRYPVVAELLADGDFVLRHKKNKNRDSFLWHSFDFPTDTLLPGMHIGYDPRKGLNISLTSWKSSYDPSIGIYSYRVEINGLPELILWNTEAEGPPMYRNTIGDVRFSLTNTSYAIREKEKEQGYLQLKLTSVGVLQQSRWSPTTEKWTSLWTAPTDECDILDWYTCGSNSFCRFEQGKESCSCFKGFRQWVGGCIRETELSCIGNGFQKLEKVKLPYTKEAIVARSIDSKECRKMCLKDCNCTGCAHVDLGGISGLNCLIYKGNFFDTRTLTVEEGGQEFFVKVAQIYLDNGASINTKIKLVIASGVFLLVILTFAMFWWWYRKRKQQRRTRAIDLLMDRNRTDVNKDSALSQMDFGTISEATNKFCNSNKLGKGGFGIVYKGTLLDGNEIAVKRLVNVSVEGASQFMNEANLISKLQHINLVRLLGYCIHGEDYMVVYEYLENLSLDFHLFGNTNSERPKLTWPIRCGIIDGIARGLTYLHQDSVHRIIHRDLKASNILLDKNMVPKISDFGTARLVGRDETQTNTREIAGTRGYISPVYLNEGIFSDKSDVYSFGVLLLELLSGKRSYRFMNSGGDTSLLSWVWRNWEDESLQEIVDPFIMDSLASPSTELLQIERYIRIALLCVQRLAQDRPKMSSLVVMLASGEAVPRPKPPGFCDHYATYPCFEIGSTSTGPSPDQSVLEGR